MPSTWLAICWSSADRCSASASPPADASATRRPTCAALLLSALTFQRPGNIRATDWSEIDAEAALWAIPAAKMKRTKAGKLNGRPHRVPLSTQALAVLAEMRPLTGHGKYVLPSLLKGERCMSENTVRGALRRVGYTNQQKTAHGNRATARTMISEQFHGISPDAGQAQLGHAKTGPLGIAYSRAETWLSGAS